MGYTREVKSLGRLPSRATLSFSRISVRGRELLASRLSALSLRECFASPFETRSVENPHFSRKGRARNGAPGAGLHTRSQKPVTFRPRGILCLTLRNSLSRKSPLLAQRTREKWGTRCHARDPSLRLKNGSIQDDASQSFDVELRLHYCHTSPHFPRNTRKICAYTRSGYTSGPVGRWFKV